MVVQASLFKTPPAAIKLEIRTAQDLNFIGKTPIEELLGLLHQVLFNYFNCIIFLSVKHQYFMILWNFYMQMRHCYECLNQMMLPM
ncbi:Hypothetical protein ETEE_0295 [Edwardsiella anguillarum ET080813]|uniref:Uncharacterized protein n=1 Tax=Edwardsiella anguillarum ET080813 TaxID=667120 RepID=A0A076LJL1_9GAMM|nr:Hypothetical protein ETEE_0295 [Edwardsiella anguillarum ET080813]